MSKVLKLAAISLGLISVIIGVVIYAYATAGCGVDREYQKSKVEMHLKEIGLPLEFLKYDEKQTTECRTSFIYISETENIHFMVIDGGKVTWWDFKERGN